MPNRTRSQSVALSASSATPARRPKRRPAHEPIDDINKAIIIELQKDGRRSYTAIADAVGLSEAAVRQRVQRLIDDGAMQIVAVTDPLRLGFRRMAMVGMRIDGDATKVAEALQTAGGHLCGAVRWQLRSAGGVGM